MKIYDEAGHAFMNPGNSSGYRKADADDAWKRISDHLGATLKSRK
jgi:dienelactone hydrolase